MSDFKGTRTKKGELKWIRSGMGFQILTADSYYSICEAVGKRGQEEQVANAQLIAAAPEMLSTLLKVQKAINEMDYSEIEGLYNEVEESINKALNKQ